MNTVELSICGSNHISVEGNNFSYGSPVTPYIMPVADLFAGHGEVFKCCNDGEPEICFTL